MHPVTLMPFQRLLQRLVPSLELPVFLSEVGPEFTPGLESGEK